MNGETAEDGDFLQIMMITREDTEMDRLPRKVKVDGQEMDKKSLLNLKLRYGKMVGENGSTEAHSSWNVLERSVFFETVQETDSLRRRGGELRGVFCFSTVTALRSITNLIGPTIREGAHWPARYLNVSTG